MYVCMYVGRYECMFCVDGKNECMYVSMYACVYVCTYACMYVRRYVCVHVCMYTDYIPVVFGVQRAPLDTVQ